MFSDYCPIISAEASNGDVIEFFSDRNEEKVSIPFWTCIRDLAEPR